MNQYMFLHRITGPAMLLTFGICALLDQWGILNFGRSWPLYLIVLGVIKLAQRAALLTAEPPPWQPGYPGYYAPPGGVPGTPATASTALVPTDTSITPTNDSGDRR